MLQGMKQLNIGASKTGQGERVQAVALALVPSDQGYLSRIGDDYFMAKFGEQAADPG
jgi:hypothetical protein